MSQEKEKVKYLLPGDRPPLDTTIKTVNVSMALFVGTLVTFIAINIIFLMTWRTLPFLPLPPSELPAFTHLKGFWRMILPFLSLGDYGEQLYQWKINNWFGVLGWRYLIAIIGGIGIGIAMFFVALTPVGGDKHIKGKLLLKGLQAYRDLKREFSFMSKDGRGSGLVVAADKKFDPTKQTIADLKPGTFIELPEKLRRSHFMFIGGTGRGKTQAIMYRLVAQGYGQIRRGEKVKLLIADTPKSDYARYFHKHHVWSISPAEDSGIAWDIAKDLTDALLANAFWKGKIPSNESDPIWPNAAIAIGTGCTKFLQVVAPKAWNYGMLAHMFTQRGEVLEPLLSEHYPEANQIIGAAGETLSSVMFNLGTYTADLIALGRIYDGFDIKKAVRQATAKALKNDTYLNFVCTDMIRANITTANEAENMTRSLMFKGACRYLTAENEKWTWKDFAKFVSLSKFLQANLAAQYLNPENEAKVVHNLAFPGMWMELAATIIHYADEWDRLESQKRLSIRDWVINENPSRKILLLKPSETYPTLTEGLIKGILYYTNSVILGRLQDDRKRRFHILIDELQSYGNIEPFLGPALSLYRSRGCSITVAFQDLAQLVKIYGQEFVDFMNSNIGNINILGVNDGFTANKLSDLLGEKKIEKLHRHRNADGGFNEDLQHHDEKVMYAAEFNTLGANDATMNIKYLSLIAGLNPAYILDAPIIPYKVRHEIKPASWIDAEPLPPPKLPDLRKKWAEKVDEPKPSAKAVAVAESVKNAFEPTIESGKTLEDFESEFLEAGMKDDDDSEWNKI